MYRLQEKCSIRNSSRAVTGFEAVHINLNNNIDTDAIQAGNMDVKDDF